METRANKPEIKSLLAEIVLIVTLIGGCTPFAQATPTESPSAQPSRTPSPLPTYTIGPIPKPTATSRPAASTPTPALTPTADLLLEEIDAAGALWKERDFEGAILKNIFVLEHAQDSSTRLAVLAVLAEMGKDQKYEFDFHLPWADTKEERKVVCENGRLALTAYESVILAHDGGLFDKTRVYRDAARLQSQMGDCYLNDLEPKKTRLEIIHFLAEKAALYPAEPEIMDNFQGPILKEFRKIVQESLPIADDDEFAEIVETGEWIKAEIGGYVYVVAPLSEEIDATLMYADLCVSKNPRLPLHTSPIKGIYSCDPLAERMLSFKDLTAAGPGEIWYLIKRETTASPDLNCAGVNPETGKNFDYSYPGQHTDVFTLVDSLTGKVLTSKTFISTAPKCVFTSCHFNTIDGTTRCSGGQAQETFNSDDLISLLTAVGK
jgi:hypothetical protein